MIWDDVTALYDGKAYVGTGGTYGVLDPEATLAKIDHITQSNCYPEGCAGHHLPRPAKSRKKYPLQSLSKQSI